MTKPPPAGWEGMGRWVARPGPPAALPERHLGWDRRPRALLPPSPRGQELSSPAACWKPPPPKGLSSSSVNQKWRLTGLPAAIPPMEVLLAQGGRGWERGSRVEDRWLVHSRWGGGGATSSTGQPLKKPRSAKSEGPTGGRERCGPKRSGRTIRNFRGRLLIGSALELLENFRSVSCVHFHVCFGIINWDMIFLFELRFLT